MTQHTFLCRTVTVGCTIPAGLKLDFRPARITPRANCCPRETRPARIFSGRPFGAPFWGLDPASGGLRPPILPPAGGRCPPPPDPTPQQAVHSHFLQRTTQNRLDEKSFFSLSAACAFSIFHFGVFENERNASSRVP
jgi:hypothetical protein